MRLLVMAFAILVAVAMPAERAAALPLIETPSLKERVQSGDLPPIAQRIPQDPLIVDLRAQGRTPGVPGGTMRMFVTRSKDVRYMAAYGYARLVGYNMKYKLVPDILKAVTYEDDGRTVVLHLRRGHKWSDGKPFTTEDFRYWWEDVALNKKLSPQGPPVEMLVDGQRPVVKVIDEVTISYTWPRPNPLFLPSLARARPVYIYQPAHYLKQFHEKYADPKKLAALVEKAKARNWAQLHNRMNNLYKFDNPDLPVLQPWVNTSKKNGQRYELERNPFFHRIDENGRQLPYIDTVELEIAAGGLIPLKVTNGEATLQVRSLSFTDAPVLKKNEKQGHYIMHLWRAGNGSEVAIYPNLNYADPVWRKIMRDVRFRRALSLAISRKAINKVLYFGLAKPAAVAALKESPFYDPANTHAWAKFDLAEANKLLDEMGLDKRDSAGIRKLPDGRPMEVIVETAGERPETSDTLELVGATWEQIGIRLLVRSLDRDVLRNRAYSGRSMMVAWYGWNNGIPTPDASPAELAPVDQANFSWPRWGQYYQTKGKAGVACDMAEPKKLLDLYNAWLHSTNDEQKSEAWRKMLKIQADQVFAIGTVNRAPVPVVAADNLHNVPDEGLYAWDPGAQLGIHRIDEFYLDPERRQ